MTVATRIDPEKMTPRWQHFAKLHAAAHDENKQARTWPTPPRHVVARTGGGLTPHNQLLSGAVDWLMMARAFEENGFDFEGKRVLEFGCGGGRVLRGFDGYAKDLRLTGCDIDFATISWNRQNLLFADWYVNPLDPATDFRDGLFDAVYAFSVFSHLPMERHFRWLREISRIVKPGGMAVLTTMGETCWRLYAEGKRPTSRPYPSELAGQLDTWRKNGFAFFPLDEITWGSKETADYYSTVDLAEYGNTFITERFIRERWEECGWKLVELRPAPAKWQDFVVLQRL
jgi:2-polyprenyl-3-methyl-5-hydroxy-6-metoxy-1,4-benzoquinol methylase